MTREAADTRGAAPSSRPWLPILVVGVTTAAAVTFPAVFMFSWFVPAVGRIDVPLAMRVVIGLSIALVALAGPAAVWSATVARVAGRVAWPVTRTTLRVALPMLVLVGLAVDSSQFLTNHIRRWHRLAVHGLFALAFAIGMAAFLGVVSWRVARVIPSPADAPGSVPTAAAVGRRVATATGLGVVAGAILALPLGWAVVVGMGHRMLEPLYLVLATGTLSGGLVLGGHLAGRAVRVAPTASTTPG